MLHAMWLRLVQWLRWLVWLSLNQNLQRICLKKSVCCDDAYVRTVGLWATYVCVVGPRKRVIWYGSSLTSIGIECCLRAYWQRMVC